MCDDRQMADMMINRHHENIHGAHALLLRGGLRLLQLVQDVERLRGQVVHVTRERDVLAKMIADEREECDGMYTAGRLDVTA